jgi:hypothetical protein
MSARRTAIAAALLAAFALVAWLVWRVDAEPPAGHTRQGSPAAQPPAARSADAPPRTSVDAPPPPPAPASTSAPAARPAMLRVRVYRTGDVAVPGARIETNEAVAGKPRVLGVTDANGELAVVPRKGTWALRVAPDSLPPGVMPPAAQDREAPPGTPDGYLGRTVRFDGSVDVVVALRCWQAATVTGVVVDGAGAPIAACPVWLQARGAGLAALSADTTTRADGVFVFDAVVPGAYSVHVHSAPLAAPLPQRVDIAEGERVPLPPLVAGDAPVRVVGRLLDRGDRPFVGVDVVVSPVDDDGTYRLEPIARAVTDAQGRFELRVQRARLKLQPHPGGSLLRHGDSERLQRPMQPVPLDTRIANDVDVGTLRGDRSVAFVLEVHVTTDEQRVRAADPTLPPRLRAPDVFVAAAADVNDERKWTRLEERDGAWRHVGEATGESVLLVVRRRGFAPLQRQVDATPGTQRLALTYP